jgi:hypothetical protein
MMIGSRDLFDSRRLFFSPFTFQVVAPGIMDFCWSRTVRVVSVNSCLVGRCADVLLAVVLSLVRSTCFHSSAAAVASPSQEEEQQQTK